MLSTKDFDYFLPEELIAQHPPEKRGAARMLVLDRKSGKCEIRRFSDITEYLSSGDCVVVNNTRVMNARFYGRKEHTGAKIEFLLTMPLNETAMKWKSLIKPGKRVRPGTVVKLDLNDMVEHTPEGFAAKVTVLEKNQDGSFNIEFTGASMELIQELCGHTPLPPYIKRPDEQADKERYQTVFAKTPGAVAAPTAGLHFTDEVFAEIAEKGVVSAEVTLHVGPGTFKPVSVDNPRDHKMHEEVYTLTEENAEIINSTRKKGNRVLAVGTTSVRVLETCADANGFVIPGSGVTDIFLCPPLKPKVPDMLLTNFHLPKSTLLMLVSSFTDREYVLNAYEVAKNAGFMFYSYGDCMLLV